MFQNVIFIRYMTTQNKLLMFSIIENETFLDMCILKSMEDYFLAG
jgi:hypothetical protein